MDEEETKSFIDDKEYETFLSDNCLNDYLRIIKSYKPAKAEENAQMIALYRNGKLDLRDDIINRNMRLVLSVVYRIGSHLSPEEKLEYIQSGTIGLITAIDRYDSDKGAFSTCADFWIKKEIYQYKYNNQELIRRPIHFLEKTRKYQRLVKESNEKRVPLPSREEICKFLEITEDTLKLIEEDYKLNATSLDAPLKNDDEKSSTVGDFVEAHDNSFSEVLDSIVLKEWLETFVMTFDPYDYYILYYRLFFSETKSLQEIGDYFGVSKQLVGQNESNILLKVKKMFDANTKTLKRHYIIKAKQDSQGYNIKTTPITLEDYTLFFFLRDTLNASEQFILRQMLLSNLEITPKNIANYTAQRPRQAQATFDKLTSLIKDTKASPRYQLFSNMLIGIYGKKLYKLSLDTNFSYYLDIRNTISLLWQDKNVDELLENARNLGYDNLLELINRFFGFAPIKSVTYNPRLLERDINYIIYGFARHEVSIAKLYPVFLANQDRFNETQRNYLLTYVFKKHPTSDIPNNLQYKDQYLIDRLLMLSFKVQDYKNDNFSKEKYLSIRDKCTELIDDTGIKLLDLYYGIKGIRHTIQEMSTLLSEDYAEVEKIFRRAKYKAISIYLGVNQENWDRNIYAEILKDETLKLLSPHREIATMFFIDRMPYEEILAFFPKEKKLTARKISEYMKYACLVMDYHRFGISSTSINYPASLLSEVLESSSYDDEFKETMRIFTETKSTSITMERCNKSPEYVKNSVRKLRALAYKKIIEDVEITKDDVQKAVHEHPSTNILTKREKIILSMYYGLNNEFNPSGKRAYPMVIAQRLNIKNNIGTHVRKAIEHVKAHKIGFLKTAIDFINRDELENILQDVHLPISDVEKSYIIDAYGLYDNEYLTFKQIAEKYGVREPSVRDRIYHGIVTIKKYQMGEIKGELYYPLDVEPYLKYFILEDREILKLLFQDKKQLIDIEKRFNLSSHQMQILLNKIRMHLEDLRQGKVIGIDFDFFWKCAMNDDIPFYGNRDLAVELCFLYYEKRISQSDIIKFFHPELEDKAVNALIRDFTAAIVKRQHGIVKANDFSYEEVLNYYNSHYEELTGVADKQYQAYFAKVAKKGPHAKYRPNKDITFDLIKEKWPNYFKLSESTPDSIRELLREYGHLMPLEIRTLVENIFGVTHYTLLPEDDIDKLVIFVNQMGLSKLLTLVRNVK